MHKSLEVRHKASMLLQKRTQIYEERYKEQKNVDKEKAKARNHFYNSTKLHIMQDKRNSSCCVSIVTRNQAFVNHKTYHPNRLQDIFSFNINNTKNT